MTTIKLQITNKFPNNNIQVSRHYDLEERTLNYGISIIKLVKLLPKNTVNATLSSQVIRSGTSMGANYREANETETKKDFKFRIRICRKEGKETIYWLNLILKANPEFKEKILPLIDEATQLVKIFAAILIKSV